MDPAGPEFQVNTYTVSAQRFPAAAAEADGDFVIAWDSGSQDGSGYGVFARRFTSAGVSLATEFQVTTLTGGGQRLPSAAVDADGDFVIAWRGTSPAAYEVFLSRFSSGGTLLTGQIQVNTYTPDQQLNPAVASEADGDFVVTWFSLTQDGATGGIFARRFSSAGAALASEFQVNAYTPDDQRYPSVSAAANGDFVVAWQSYLQDGASWGVFARSFSSAGAPLTGELQVNAYTVNGQSNPSVAVSASGQFVVVWQSSLQDGYLSGVFARRFSSSGAALANEFQINAYTTGGERNASVAVDAEGDFIVAWDDGIEGSVFARRFSSAGLPLTGNFLVNTYTPDNQFFPSVAASASGDFVVAWESHGGQDGSNLGVFAQRFAEVVASAVLDIDGNGTLDPLTDGLLQLRGLFGFTGAILTTGAVGGMCTRCDATAISSTCRPSARQLDIDGNGSTDPLTDGLLALRFLFGFTDATLTAGAIGVGCSRCDAPSIEAYLVLSDHLTPRDAAAIDTALIPTEARPPQVQSGQVLSIALVRVPQRSTWPPGLRAVTASIIRRPSDARPRFPSKTPLATWAISRASPSLLAIAWSISSSLEAAGRSFTLIASTLSGIGFSTRNACVPAGMASSQRSESRISSTVIWSHGMSPQP